MINTLWVCLYPQSVISNRELPALPTPFPLWAIIVIIVVAAVFLLFLLIIMCACCWRRHLRLAYFIYIYICPRKVGLKIVWMQDPLYVMTLSQKYVGMVCKLRH